MNYNFTHKAQKGCYEVAVDPQAQFGYFEHDDYGDAYGGGLWFDLIDEDAEVLITNLELRDYDGVACLPRDVAAALRDFGITVSEDFA